MSDDVRGAEGEVLRGELAQLEDANKELEARVTGKALEYAVRDAGFDPTKGEGKAIAAVYDGDPDPERIAEFAAAEFGFQPGASEVDLREQVAQQRADGEARLRMLGQGALPVRDPSLNDQLAEAEARGDWETHGRLNAQKLMEAARHPYYQRPAGR